MIFEVPHIVGAQRDAASTASAEFGLAVGAEVAAAVGKLGFAADATGGRIVLLLGLLTPRLGPDATHLLLVALKLLVQCSVAGGEENVEDSLLVPHHSLTLLGQLDKFSPSGGSSRLNKNKTMRISE